MRYNSTIPQSTVLYKTVKELKNSSIASAAIFISNLVLIGFTSFPILIPPKFVVIGAGVWCFPLLKL